MIRIASSKSCLLFLTVFCLSTGVTHAQIGGTAGAYSRMGFGARGMAMGNALTAVTSGDAISYYNPATIPLAEYRNASASFGILSFDRRLNFLGFTQPLARRLQLTRSLHKNNETVQAFPSASLILA